jgi:hypothetical protein
VGVAALEQRSCRDADVETKNVNATAGLWLLSMWFAEGVCCDDENSGMGCKDFGTLACKCGLKKLDATKDVGLWCNG